MLQYHRTQIETGEFWRKNVERFNVRTRVDTTLMSNLKVIRKTLLNNVRGRKENEGIDEQSQSRIVHALLGRSILIKYLEERTDSNENTVFPEDYFSSFRDGAKEYTDVLRDKDATYTLFRKLEEKFNGDMFPLIEQETSVITQDDLDELRHFILGDSDLASRQMVMWPLYSFNIIPIHLISSIYELFFHLAETDPTKEKGTYYTPFHLVEMLMDEVLSWDGSYVPKKILDPACGSGIFLVEAYRRLIGRWMHSHQSENITTFILEDILQSCIYGIDCNEEAIRIASFSLSLVMCDFLEPRTIWGELHFPRLLCYNLFHNDFFEQKMDWEKKDYDIVIGNPPWASKMSLKAADYIRNTKQVIGDKQIAQAFTWRVADVCPNGIICFLLPSKGFLFNRSPTSTEYRKRFFEQCDVSVIINYSIFRKILFKHASGPAVGVVYRAHKSNERNSIFYCTPKPLYTVEDRKSFLIEPYDICRIPVELAQEDLIWKIAMWGGPRDLDLIRSIQLRYASFQTILDKYSMDYAEGFKIGNKKQKCRDFWDQPLIEPTPFTPGENHEDELPRVDFEDFECVVKQNRRIFQAPHLIIKQSHKKSKFLADVLDFDAVFNHSLAGVHGDKDILKYFCLIISSKVFSYYQLMTNRRWLVERDELEFGDVLATPFPLPTETSVREAVELFESVFRNGGDASLVDEFAYRQYELRPYEKPLVTEAIDCVYDFFDKKAKSIALQPPTDNLLHQYTQATKEILRNTLGQAFALSCCIYRGDAPLLIACIELAASSEQGLIRNCPSQEMNALLENLDRQLIESRSGSVFVKRNARIYNEDRIYIIKPNQTRYWNYSAACRDADDLYADVMRAWRNENEQY